MCPIERQFGPGFESGDGKGGGGKKKKTPESDLRAIADEIGSVVCILCGEYDINGDYSFVSETKNPKTHNDFIFGIRRGADWINIEHGQIGDREKVKHYGFRKVGGKWEYVDLNKKKKTMPSRSADLPDILEKLKMQLQIKKAPRDL